MEEIIAKANQDLSSGKIKGDMIAYANEEYTENQNITLEEMQKKTM